MVNNILNFPTVKGGKWRKQMADELRRYADILERERDDPAIKGFVICFHQGGEFKFGGCGTLTQDERKAMTSSYFKFIDSLRRRNLS